jgi:hypothetical protein
MTVMDQLRITCSVLVTFEKKWQHSAVYSCMYTPRNPVIRLGGKFCVTFGLFIKLVRGRREMRTGSFSVGKPERKTSL